MLSTQKRTRQKQRAGMTAELIVAIAILAGTMIPLAYSFQHEHKLARALYYRSVAMEIVDGEMEFLKAGEWQTYSQGAQEYRVQSLAASQLPPGRFVLTVRVPKLRLEWAPAKRGRGGIVAREVDVGGKERSR